MIKIPIDRIIIGDVLRVPHPAHINRLAKSIRKTSMEHPIKVTKNDDGIYNLIDGYARLQACQQLGMERVECLVMDEQAMNADIAKIKEHLIEVAPIKTLGQCLKEAMTTKTLIARVEKFCDGVKIGQYELNCSVSFHAEWNAHLVTLECGPDPWHTSVKVTDEDVDREQVEECFLTPMRRALELAVANEQGKKYVAIREWRDGVGDEVTFAERLAFDASFEECARAISKYIDIDPEVGKFYACLDVSRTFVIIEEQET